MVQKIELKIKCFNHFERESVAICTACKNSFCRECVSFYEEKMTCSNCIKSKIKSKKDKLYNKASVLTVFVLLLFLSAGLLFFYFLGSLLAQIPSEFKF